ncbi:hypothetical protein [Agrobacterium sp. MCAB5]|uniref:hypothetical protein n=1 Tax=Agrobacterium sp. MCAB5 TaxID=3233042 RepID=UPI003F8DF089
MTDRVGGLLRKHDLPYSTPPGYQRRSPIRRPKLTLSLAGYRYALAAADGADIDIAFTVSRKNSASRTQAGLIVGIYALFYALGQLPAQILNRHNQRRVDNSDIRTSNNFSIGLCF